MLAAVIADHLELGGWRQVALTQSEDPMRCPRALSLELRRSTSELRRSTSCGGVLRVILTKLHHDFSMDTSVRDIVWNNILREARSGSESWLVTGGLRSKSNQLLYQVTCGHRFGSELAPTHVFSCTPRAHHLRTEQTVRVCGLHGVRDVVAGIQVSKDGGDGFIDPDPQGRHIQTAASVHFQSVQDTPSSYIRVLDVPMPLEASAAREEARRNSDVAPLAEPMLHSRSNALLRALDTADDGSEISAEILFAPHAETSVAEDGSLVVHSLTRADCALKLDTALRLIAQARAFGMQCQVSEDRSEYLTDKEYERALAWLKTMVEKECITNEDIMASLRARDAGELDRKGKAALRQRLRGACKTCLHDLLGDYHFGLALTRWGDFSPAALHNLLRELHTHRVTQDAAEPAPVDLAPLKTAAFEARGKYRRGALLRKRVDESTTSYEALSSEEQQLLLDFDSGKLLRAKRAANAAYGFGDGAEKRLSINQLIAIGAHSREMDEYSEWLDQNCGIR